MGKVLGLIRTYFTWEMAEEFVHCSALFACFSTFVCPIAGLQRATVKLQIVSATIFIKGNRQRLKDSAIKVLTIKLCLKASSVKSSAQTRKCFEGVKHSLLICISHSLLSFVCWLNLKEKTLDF